MKSTDLCRLSARNIVRHPKTSLQMFAGIFFASVIFLSIVLYYFMLRERLEETSLQLKSLDCVQTAATEIAQVQNLAEDCRTRDLICSVGFFSTLPEESPYMPFFSQLTLSVDGQAYTAVRSSSLQPDDYYDVKLCAAQYNTISENESQEFAHRFSEKMFLAGRNIRQDNEIILSEAVCGLYRIPHTQWSDLIGKRISLSVQAADESGDILQIGTDFVICGILCDAFRTVYSRGEDSVFITQRPLEELFSFNGSVNVTVNLSEFDDLAGVAQEMEETYALPFSYSGRYDEIRYIDAQAELVRRVFFIAGSVIILSVIFNSIRLFWYHTQQKKVFFGALLAMGLTQHDLRLLSFGEIAWISLVALLLSSTVSIVLMTMFSQQLSAFLSLQMEINAMTCCKAVLITTAFHAVVLLTSFWIAMRSLRHSEIAELVRA